jgi:hypothetical protein
MIEAKREAFSRAVEINVAYGRDITWAVGIAAGGVALVFSVAEKTGILVVKDGSRILLWGLFFWAAVIAGCLFKILMHRLMMVDSQCSYAAAHLLELQRIQLAKGWDPVKVREEAFQIFDGENHGKIGPLKRQSDTMLKWVGRCGTVTWASVLIGSIWFPLLAFGGADVWRRPEIHLFARPPWPNIVGTIVSLVGAILMLYGNKSVRETKGFDTMNPSPRSWRAWLGLACVCLGAILNLLTLFPGR